MTPIDDRDPRRVDQCTAFCLMPVCLRCGGQNMIPMRGSRFYVCTGCWRTVVYVEYAAEVFEGTPSDPRVPTSGRTAS